MKKLKALFESDYVFLWDDGTIGVSDGVGYSGSLSQEEVEKLYLALKDYFEKENHEDLL